jgi:Tol biopolymer transport system component
MRCANAAFRTVSPSRACCWAALSVLCGACSEGTVAPSFGVLKVQVQSSGTGSDPDGFRVAVDGTGATVVGVENPVFLTVSAGSHQVALLGVAHNCVSQGKEIQPVTVSPGDTSEVGFDVSCQPIAGDVEVTTASSGSDIDPNGYVLVLDGTPRLEIESTETATLAMTAGRHEIALSGLTANCAVSGSNVQEVEVSAGATTQVDFEITCEPAPSAGHGNELAFVRSTIDTSTAEVTAALYLMNADGTGVRMLLPDFPGNQTDPDWAPGGDRLVFAADSSRFGSVFPFELNVFTLGGASPVGLSIEGFTDCCTGKLEPRWSPDGSRIAFTHNIVFFPFYHSYTEATIVGADGSSPVAVFNSTDNLTNSPSWSPDGSRLAFEVATIVDFDTQGPAAIYIQNLATSETRLLVSGVGGAIHPAWSPDGARIAYASGGDIYIIAADGGEPVRLTEGPGNDDRPAWSPDGSRVAFSRERHGNSEIYVIDANRDNLTRLTNNPALDTYPAWRP